MENGVENTTAKTEKELSLSDVFYVFCKHIVWEILIFVIIFGAGLGFAFKSKNYYVASADVLVKAGLSDETKPSYNDTILAQKYLPTVCDVLKTPTFILRASRTLGEDKQINAGNLSAKYNDDSLVIKISYKDGVKEDSASKLKAIISEIETFSKEVDDSGNSKYFAAEIKVVAISDEAGAVTPMVKTVSDKNKILLVSAVIGIVAIIAYAFCVVMFGDKVSSVEKLEKVTGKRNVMTIGKKRLSKEDRKNNANESTRKFIKFNVDKLADTLIYLSDDGKNQVYQIQSAVAGEGKTTVAINLAVNLGSNARRTLIIDCDFAHPTVHRAFKLSRIVGITDYFKGEKDFDGIVKHTAYENLDIITCGETITDHTIFFTSRKFKNIMEEARKRYDFVILDCAPIKLMSDYINVSPLVDATVLVVESDRTSARDLARIVEDLRVCNANLIGTVFNFSNNTNNKNNYYYKKNLIAETEMISDTPTGSPNVPAEASSDKDALSE